MQCSKSPPGAAAARFQLAQKLITLKAIVAQAVTDDYSLQHSEPALGQSERGRHSGAEEVSSHIGFLTGAIEADSPAVFADYLRWTGRMLAARGIPATTVYENIVLLEKHLRARLSPEEWETVAAFLITARPGGSDTPSPRQPRPSHSLLSLTQEAYLMAILGARRQSALSIIEEALNAGHSHVDIYVDVFAESLHRIGELWEQNKITVAQEHIATSITQYAIASIYPRLIPGTVRRGSMVVTGVAGELHQIGANLVADAMEAKGWTVRFLGTDLPHSSVLSVVEESAANVLCISTTLAANLPSAAELVRFVRTNLKEHAPRILLGGSAYRLGSGFARDIAATGAINDLRGALALLCA